MNELLEFVAELVKWYPLHVNISYAKMTDWTISIYKRGCADDGSDIIICNVQNCDVELAFAKAHVLLKNWLLDTEGGY